MPSITIELPDDPQIKELEKTIKHLTKDLRHHSDMYQRWWNRGQIMQQQIDRAIKALNDGRPGHAKHILMGIEQRADAREAELPAYQPEVKVTVLYA